MRENLQKIGRYEVTGELGRGSMGVVHLAHDPVMGRDVAIKTVLIPHGLPDEERDAYCTRFQREAQAAGRLSHPGIVTIYEFDQEPGPERPFIAMEFVEGPTLHELICSDGALNPEWVLGMAKTLADALFLAHEAGIIHRDLKPANILIRESDGAPKIADFGVARVNKSELTEAETTYGSPAYMAPERIRGVKADARSDLFSLAVIFYEALCGERPFAGDDFATTCYAILNNPPAPICERAPELAPAFDSFFATALAKEPDERFQNGTLFREALEGVWREQQLFKAGAGTMKITIDPVSGEIRGPDASVCTMRMDVAPTSADSPLAACAGESIESEPALEQLEQGLDALVDDSEIVESADPGPGATPGQTSDEDSVCRVLAELDGDLPSTEEGPPFLATALPELADSDLDSVRATELGLVRTDSGDRSPLPARWIVIGSSAVLLLLFSFAGGWFLRGTSPADLEPIRKGHATAVPQSAPTPASTTPPATKSAFAPDAALTARFREALRGPTVSSASEIAIPHTDAAPTRAPVAVAASPAAKPRVDSVPAVSAPAAPATTSSTAATRPSTPPADAGKNDARAAVTAEAAGPVVSEPALVASDVAVLTVQVRSSIKAGQLVLAVDGSQVYSADLESEARGWARMVKKAKRQAAQDLETRLEIPPGEHTIAVTIEGAEGIKSRHAELEVHLVPGDTRTLQIVAGRTFGRKLTLKLE